MIGQIIREQDLTGSNVLNNLDWEMALRHPEGLMAGLAEQIRKIPLPVSVAILDNKTSVGNIELTNGSFLRDFSYNPIQAQKLTVYDLVPSHVLWPLTALRYMARVIATVNTRTRFKPQIMKIRLGDGSSKDWIGTGEIGVFYDSKLGKNLFLGVGVWHPVPTQFSTQKQNIPIIYYEDDSQLLYNFTHNNYNASMIEALKREDLQIVVTEPTRTYFLFSTADAVLQHINTISNIPQGRRLFLTITERRKTQATPHTFVFAKGPKGFEVVE